MASGINVESKIVVVLYHNIYHFLCLVWRALKSGAQFYVQSNLIKRRLRTNKKICNDVNAFNAIVII